MGNLSIRGKACHGRCGILPHLLLTNTKSCRTLKRLIGTSSKDLFEKEVNIGRIVKRTGIHFEDMQVAPIKKTAGSKVMVLTGEPGTGKNTTTIGIIAALETMGQRVLLAALTGRSAKRMSEAIDKKPRPNT